MLLCILPSCHIIESYRSDTNLYDVFDGLFPGRIEHAEMLIDTSNLEKILVKRQKLINKYDNIDARHRYEMWRYEMWQKEGKIVSKPVEPKVCSAFLISFFELQCN